MRNRIIYRRPACGARWFIRGQPAAFALLLLAWAAAAGCGSPAGIVFEPVSPAVVWPPQPQRPRLRYVGQLATEADLKPAVSLGQEFGESLFGKHPIRAMVTPFALCTDGGDRLFVADTSAQVVHVFDLKSRQYEQWGPAPGKKFSSPVGIAYDSAGRLFVSDSEKGVIDVLDSRGQPLAAIGAGELGRPCGLAFDAKGQRLFVADSARHQVVVFAADGKLLQRLGERGTQLGQFNFPTNVVLDSHGRLYVSDSLNFRVQQFSADLRPKRAIGSRGDMPGYFSQPKGVGVDSHGHLYVVDAQFEVVQVFNEQGQLLMDFGKEGDGVGEFWLPAGLFIDAHNRVWVADSYNHRVQVFDYLPE